MFERELTRATLCGFAALAAVALAGCQSPLAELVRREGLTATLATGEPYRHLVVTRPPAATRDLHVYVGGDGVPWRGGQVPAADPTPRNLLEIRLMALDRVDAAYLGRPCYFGLASDPDCGPDVWTFARYSPAVVASMANAAREIVERGRYDRVVLIGYSGGGVLARLMAPNVPRVVGLVTVAANLDTAAWSAGHGYLPLERSLNPATERKLASTVTQIHAVGGRDTVVPRAVTDSYTAHENAAIVWSYPDYDHVCCWEQGWPEILARIEAALGSVAGSPND
jgi:hypothetical protein